MHFTPARNRLFRRHTRACSPAMSGPSVPPPGGAAAEAGSVKVYGQALQSLAAAELDVEYETKIRNSNPLRR